MSKYLIVGLGNIGTEYIQTRHNIGFDVIDAFAKKHSAAFSIERFAELSGFRFKGKQIICLMPTTYVNLSGKAVKYWVDKESIPLENMLVIVDEIALPINKVRLRPSGTDAGHNGLKSIQEMLGTTQYPRLRFGIGNNYPKGMQVDYVLSRWNEEEKPLVMMKIEKCVEIIESFIVSGIDRTMNAANKLDFML
jgi:PTH1 family peptidyl-tRNA hydrolase